MCIRDSVVGLGIEFVFAQLRGHEINEGFIVSGMLIPLVMPVETPLWMIAIATAFAVIFGKEVFGGTGMLSLIHICGFHCTLWRQGCLG